MQYRFLNQTGALSNEPASDWSEDEGSSLLFADWKPPSERERPSSKEIDLKSKSISPAVLQLVPETMAREYQVLPISLIGETLTVACLDEDDLALKDKLTFAIGKDVKLVRASKADIREMIDVCYADNDESVDCYLGELNDDVQIRFVQASRYGTHEDKVRQLERTARRFRGLEEPTIASSRTTAMFWKTIDEGEHMLMTRRNGKKEVVVGPTRVWGFGNRFDRMQHSVAHPGEFLIVRFRDGQQQHLPGPAEIWFDPRVHEEIECEECLQISAKEAVVVYSRDQSGDQPTITRRILHGPALFVPQPGEWLHKFSWHASKGGHLGVEKQPNALVFQKLWLMPDQMYHDVRDVRTADNAVLRIRLMIFFELTDIERMLDETHDPIGDFVNAATADVVGFTGKHDFESFKQNTDELNELSTYKTLTRRAEQIGYKINNVVYRGYGAADSLQKMHDQAIEARTRLQLDRATEEQTQDLENYRLESQLARSSKRRAEQVNEVRHDLELNREKQEAEIKQQQARKEFQRSQREADAKLAEEIAARQNEQRVAHLGKLREMNVDLTEYLTQSRADQVIEFRGESHAPHVHLDSGRENGNGQKSSPSKK